MSLLRRIGLLGLGEVGSTLATDLSAVSGLTLVAWDCQFGDADSIPVGHLRARDFLQRAESARAFAAGCDLVISAVTAAQDQAAAESVLDGLDHGAWFLDLNSVSPQTKRRVAEIVVAAGGRYVEAAVMSPITPDGIASPILVGGPDAEAFLPLAQQLGFAGMRFCAAELGRAVATKMCRSIIVKGFEAILTEGLLAARHYGVEEEVIRSLSNLFPHPDWNDHARYMISRSLQHGVRRAEEMREAAHTVSEAGLEPLMSSACARRQDWAAPFAAALEEHELRPMLEAVLRQSRTRETEVPQSKEGSTA